MNAHEILRNVVTVSDIVAVADHGRLRSVDAGGGFGPWHFRRTTALLVVRGPDGFFVSCTTKRLGAIVAEAITPGLCTAVAAWSASWSALHDCRPYLDKISGAGGYHHSHYRYVMDLGHQIEAAVRPAVLEALLGATVPLAPVQLDLFAAAS